MIFSGKYIHFKQRYTIIGLTHQYIHQHIDSPEYNSQLELLKGEVSRFNIHVPGNSDSSFTPDDLLNEEEPGTFRPNYRPSSSTKVQGADDFSIVSDQDFRLMLLRHWSLYESMYHSSYVAARLGIWKEKGRRRLTNLLVKMG
jgi:cell division control protein 45